MLRVRVRSPVQFTVFGFAANGRDSGGAKTDDARAARDKLKLLHSGSALRAPRRSATRSESILWFAQEKMTK